ncbi:MAG: T9SS type A sorting domain-containing protein [candidate division WOR-3 bacterium]
MKLLNKIYPLFVVWLGLFSNVNAQVPNTISPTSPFFNKIIKERINFDKPDSQKYIISANLTFNKSLICSTRAFARIVTDRNDIISDIDGNGFPDIPFGEYGGTGAYVAFQTSLGNFQCKPINFVWVYGISVGDFNGDLRKDIVYTSAWNATLHILINNGGLSFTQYQIATGGFPNHIGIRNVNLGPSAEILITDEYKRLLKYNFLTNSLTTINNTCKEGISVADINGDGAQDIVCSDVNYDTSVSMGRLYYQLNLGNNWSSMYVLSNIYGYWHGIAAADLNKDGKVDVVSCRADANLVYIFYNNGGNPPTFNSTYVNTGSDLNPCELKIADLDCDGDYDIVWSKGYGATYDIGWIENGYPNNTWTNHIIENFGYSEVYGVVVADVNKDKKPDIVAPLNINIFSPETGECLSCGIYVYYNTSNIDTTSCAPITPVDIPEKSEINAKIDVKGKEVRLLLNKNINDKLEIFDVSGKKLWTYYINGQQLTFKIPNSGVYVMRLRDKSYKVVVK